MRLRVPALGIFALLVAAAAGLAQQTRGEMRIMAHDVSGAAVAATAQLASAANDYRHRFPLPVSGPYIVPDLPLGEYTLIITAPGFAPWTKLVTLNSELPLTVAAVLRPAAEATEVRVSASATLLSPQTAAPAVEVGQRAIAEHMPAQPGRSLTDLVDSQPGWLEEANGVLHPRGAEYDVQYVEDGQPVTANQSVGFAPPADTAAVESLRVLTSGYPAEYGRKLGGIVEVTTDHDLPAGLHGTIEADGGSFGSSSGAAQATYSSGPNAFSLGVDGLHTNRYMDPPVLENFTNTASADGLSAAWQRDLSPHTRIRFEASHSRVGAEVPDELVQAQAGQRQDIHDGDTSLALTVRHIVSASLLFTTAASLESATAALDSNPQSTPIVIFQNRGYHQGDARADLAGASGGHDWQIGGDSIFNPVYERLNYQITDPTQFDPGTRLQFAFADRAWDIEPATYAQDAWHFGSWNLDYGLRFDHYGFAVHRSAWSPRLSLSRYFARFNLLLHASYDRAFQTPAIENLLLASSPLVDSLNPAVARLPVEPSYGNFYEIGLSEALAGRVRLDADVFRRDIANFSDDDTLLDTGVSFPIAFAGARIEGEEIRLAAPDWGRFSGYLSYSNQIGTAHGPITGGLFLGSDADVSNLSDTSVFYISQDQRNTARIHVRLQALDRLWLATDAQYGSGLPSDAGGEDYASLLAAYGPEVLAQVNFARGRVRPNAALDLSGGLTLLRRESRDLELRWDVANLTDHLNVINFASPFSGTAIAPPRSGSLRLAYTF